MNTKWERKENEKEEKKKKRKRKERKRECVGEGSNSIRRATQPSATTTHQLV